MEMDVLSHYQIVVDSPQHDALNKAQILYMWLSFNKHAIFDDLRDADTDLDDTFAQDFYKATGVSLDELSNMRVVEQGESR